MNKFKITKRVDLSYIGAEWKDCYLDFYSIPFVKMGELSKLSSTPDKAVEETISLLENHFMAGEAIDSAGKKVKVEKTDIKELPVDLIVKIVNTLIGQVEKKN